MLEQFNKAEAIRLPLEEVPEGHLKRLLAYWESKRGERPFPSRADIDPLDFPFALGLVCLVRHEPETNTFRYVLDGTEVAQHNAQDLTGKTIDEAQPSFYPPMLRAHFTEVIETGAPSLFRIELFSLRKFSRYHRLCLPLSIGGPKAEIVMTVSADLDQLSDPRPLVDSSPVLR